MTESVPDETTLCKFRHLLEGNGLNNTYTPGSGAYTFVGSCTSNIISTRELRLVLDGYFEITESNALSVGVDLDVCEISHSSGSTVYYRKPVYQAHVERTKVQGGG